MAERIDGITINAEMLPQFLAENHYQAVVQLFASLKDYAKELFFIDPYIAIHMPTDTLHAMIFQTNVQQLNHVIFSGNSLEQWLQYAKGIKMATVATIWRQCMNKIHPAFQLSQICDSLKK